MFVCPTSFVLDTQGNIRLGVFGAVVWDSPEAMEKIVGLLPAGARQAESAIRPAAC